MTTDNRRELVELLERVLKITNTFGEVTATAKSIELKLADVTITLKSK